MNSQIKVLLGCIKKYIRIEYTTKEQVQYIIAIIACTAVLTYIGII